MLNRIDYRGSLSGANIFDAAWTASSVFRDLICRQSVHMKHGGFTDEDLEESWEEAVAEILPASRSYYGLETTVSEVDIFSRSWDAEGTYKKVVGSHIAADLQGRSLTTDYLEDCWAKAVDSLRPTHAVELLPVRSRRGTCLLNSALIPTLLQHFYYHLNGHRAHIRRRLVSSVWSERDVDLLPVKTRHGWLLFTPSDVSTLLAKYEHYLLSEITL